MAKKDIVTIHIYGTVERMERARAKRKYLEGMACCEGAERDRYVNIYLQLMDGATECFDERW